MSKKSFFDHSDEFDHAVEKPYRTRQICEWVFSKYVFDFSLMTDLPLPLRQKLVSEWDIIPLTELSRQQSKEDDTVKFLFRAGDHILIESVLMTSRERRTLCVSTQAGCRNGCRFCATGAMGFQRDLTAGEIIGQILYASPLTNIVFMGMGEPLDNFDSLTSVLHLLNDSDKMNFGARRVTISTVGIPDKIRELAGQNRQFGLSWSLHAPDDELRSFLMPINKAYPIRKVMNAFKYYKKTTGGDLTAEYILIKGVNDSSSAALKTAGIALEIGAKVNLIPYNPHPYADFNRSENETIELFSDILQKEGVITTLRESKGKDIDAACGQLAGRHTKEVL
jgi:23S rRNA (adenine2503-C2)-methyltransferase